MILLADCVLVQITSKNELGDLETLIATIVGCVMAVATQAKYYSNTASKILNQMNIYRYLSERRE